MADYKLWNALKDAKKYRWVELSHSLNNESPYWSGIPEGSVELAKTVWDWGKPELECLIQTFKFPGQFGTHIDFPGHFIKGKALSEKYDVNDLIFPLVVIDISEQAKKDPRVIVLNESSATVAEAAHALGVEPASIAKTLSVLQGEKPVLIVTEGTAKLDNHKYKSLFHIKAKMIPYDEVEAYVGHAPGGVCPFGVNEGVAVYLDESLRKFDTVYPAAGNGHTAVKLTLQELEAAAGAEGWVDVCKEPEGE